MKPIYLSLLVTALTANGMAQEKTPPPEPAPPIPAPAPTLTPATPIQPVLPVAPGTPLPGVLPPPGLVLPPPPTAKVPTENKANDEAYAKAAADDTIKNIAVISGPTVTLDEALRITLLQQPAVKLAAEDVEIARGNLQSALAVFDTHLTANVKESGTVTPLTDDQILEQVKTRQGLLKTLQAVQHAEHQEGKSSSGGAPPISVNTDAATSTTSFTLPNSTSISGQQSNLQTLQATNAAILNQQLLNTLTAQTMILNQAFNTQQTNALAGSVAGISKSAAAGQKQVTEAQHKLLLDLDKQITKQLKTFFITTTSRSTETDYDVGLAKTFRNGITVTPDLSFTKGGKDNMATMKLDVLVPLGKGRGGVALRATEDANFLDLLASEMQLRHSISNALFQTAMAFWNLMGAQEAYQVAKQSSLVDGTFVELTSKRKELGEASDAEVTKALARQATTDLQVLQADFAVLQARHTLANTMGLEGLNLANPPFAVGTIPTSVDTTRLRGTNLAVLGLKAMTNRDDRRAALQLLRSGKILAEAAYFEIKPQADLDLSLGYAAVDTGNSGIHYIQVFGDNKVGATASASLKFDWPFALDAAKGAYINSLSTYRKAQITLFDTDRQVQNNALLAIGQVLSTSQQVAAAMTASDLALRSLNGERDRYRVGEGSLLDTLILEENLTTARQQLVQSKVSLINAIANLRFQSGTILNPESGHTPATVTFTAASFRRIPDWSTIPLPEPPSGLDSLKYSVKPVPMLQRLFGGQPDLADHDLAIRPQSMYRSILDMKQQTVIDGVPATVQPNGGKGSMVIYSAAPSPGGGNASGVTATGPAVGTTVAPQTAGTASSPSTPPNSPPARKKPTGLLQRLFQ